MNLFAHIAIILISVIVVVLLGLLDSVFAACAIAGRRNTG